MLDYITITTTIANTLTKYEQYSYSQSIEQTIPKSTSLSDYRWILV